MNYFDQVFFQKYLREGEELFFVCHRHPLLIVDRVIVMLFVGLALPTFFYYNNSFGFQTLIPFFYFEIYAVILYLYLIYNIFDWYNDVWLITHLGVVDINWSLFAYHVIYVEYSDIKSTSIETDSFWDSIFNMGDVVLFTAGDRDDFCLQGAENPHEIADHIEEALHEVAERKKLKDKEPMDLLLYTLTEVVREHLSGNHSLPKEDEQIEKEVEKILSKKGTIDLR